MQTAAPADTSGHASGSGPSAEAPDAAEAISESLNL